MCDHEVESCDCVDEETECTDAPIQGRSGLDWIGLRSVLRPRQHSIGYMGDGFYRSKDPTNSIKVLKEKAVQENNQKTKKTQITHMHTHTK